MLKRFSRRWSVVVCIPTLERWERGIKTNTYNYFPFFLVPNVFVGNAYRDAPASHLIKKMVNYVKTVLVDAGASWETFPRWSDGNEEKLWR